jgi:periplasmic protein TonB
MFETATFSYDPSSKRVWTTAMGFTGQAVLIGCLTLAPLVSPQTLGRAFLVTGLVAPGAPSAPLPPGPRVEPVPRGAAARPTNTNVFTEPAPNNIPAIAATIIDPPDTIVSGSATRGGVVGGVDTGSPGAGSNLIDRITQMVPVVRPPEVVNRPPVATATAPVNPPRITSIRMATPIYKVEPIYPHLAKVAGVSGVVELLGVLGTDGRIHELKVLRGHPLLVGAALDAVRQWIFQPTLLNGQAVEVAAPITVNFILKR